MKMSKRLTVEEKNARLAARAVVAARRAEKEARAEATYEAYRRSVRGRFQSFDNFLEGISPNLSGLFIGICVLTVVSIIISLGIVAILVVLAIVPHHLLALPLFIAGVAASLVGVVYSIECAIDWIVGA